MEEYFYRNFQLAFLAGIQEAGKAVVLSGFY